MLQLSAVAAPPRWLIPVAIGVFVFGFAQELWLRYLPAYLRFLGASAFLVGAFGSLQDLLDAAYAWPGGWLSDRLGHQGALLLFAGLTTAGFVVYLISASVAAIFAGMLLIAAWNSLGLPAMFSLIGENLAGSRRVLGFTIQSVLRRLPIVIAPPLGGAMLERAGMARGMRIGFAVSILLSGAMLIGLRRALRTRRADRAERTGAPAVFPGCALSRPRGPATRLDPALKRLLTADCLIRLCEGLPDVFLVLWALEVLRLSPSRFGLATSVLMGTAILSYFPAAALSRHVEKKPFVIATFIFFTLFPLAVVWSRSFPQLLGAYALGGLREIGEPARKALIVDLSPAAARGRTVGLYYAVRGFAVAGAAAVGGVLWSIRPELTFYAAAALGCAGTLWAARTLPSGRIGPEEASA